MLPLIGGGAIGAIIGQRLAPHLPELRLRQGFSALLIGSALLTHLCLAQTKLSVAADAYVAIVAGGGPAGGVVGAKWRATAVEAPATSPASPTVAVTAFTVQGIPAGGAAVAVGPLTLRVGAPGVK